MSNTEFNEAEFEAEKAEMIKQIVAWLRDEVLDTAMADIPSEAFLRDVALGSIQTAMKIALGIEMGVWRK